MSSFIFQPNRNCAQPCLSFSDYFTHNPYCIVDPTCRTPFTHFYSAHAGFAGNDYVGMNHYSGLAIANYAFFLGAMTLLLVLARRLTSANRRLLATVAVVTWCFLEPLRWILAIDHFAVPEPMLVLKDRAIVIVTVLIPVLLATGIHRLGRRGASRRDSGRA